MLLVIDVFEIIYLLFTLTCSLVKNRVNIYDFTNFAITQKSDCNFYTSNDKIKKDINTYFKQMKIKILCEDKFHIEMDDEIFENNSTIEEIIEELEELLVD